MKNKIFHFSDLYACRGTQTGERLKTKFSIRDLCCRTNSLNRRPPDGGRMGENMRNLLSADFVRLIHDRFFHICLIFMVIVGILGRILVLPGSGQEYVPCLNDGFMGYVPFPGILQAAFCSLFIGRDYSAGTIRNKIMAGHTRSAIYLSNLLICLVAGLLICAAYLLSACAVGIPLMGFFKNAPVMLLPILYSLAISAAFSSVFTLLSMLIHSRSAAVAVSTLGIFALLFVSFFIHGRLQEPEIHPAVIYQDDSGNLITEESAPNPWYVGGSKRAVMEFLTEFLPTGQTALLLDQDAVPPTRLFIWDAVLILAVTGPGLFLFGRKDLK